MGLEHVSERVASVGLLSQRLDGERGGRAQRLHLMPPASRDIQALTRFEDELLHQRAFDCVRVEHRLVPAHLHERRALGRGDEPPALVPVQLTHEQVHAVIMKWGGRSSVPSQSEVAPALTERSLAFAWQRYAKAK